MSVREFIENEKSEYFPNLLQCAYNNIFNLLCRTNEQYYHEKWKIISCITKQYITEL